MTRARFILDAVFDSESGCAVRSGHHRETSYPPPSSLDPNIQCHVELEGQAGSCCGPCASSVERRTRSRRGSMVPPRWKAGVLPSCAGMCAGGVTTVPPNSAVACGTPSLSAYHHVVFCADSADETDRGPVPVGHRSVGATPQDRDRCRCRCQYRTVYPVVGTRAASGNTDRLPPSIP